MKRLRFWVVWVGLFCLTVKPGVAANDVVTLNSGETIAGRITSENDTQLEIEVSNASQTIFTTRTVLKSEIKSVQRETAEAKKERLAYEGVQRYRLNPDQEFTAAQYDAGMALCRKFLDSYPNGEYAASAQQLGTQLQQEKKQVEKGFVKCGNHWMLAGQKRAEQVLRSSFNKLQQARFADKRKYEAAKEEYEAAKANRDDWAAILARRERGDSAMEWAAKHPRADFAGLVETINTKDNTITIKSYATNEVKQLQIIPDSRFVTVDDSQATISYFAPTNKVSASYYEERGNLILLTLTEITSVPGAGGSIWDEGAVNFLSCRVVGIASGNGGLVVEATATMTVEIAPSSPMLMPAQGGYGSVGAFASPGISSEGLSTSSRPSMRRKTTKPPSLIVVVNHPKDRLLAEGETFQATVRRESVVEGTDKNGNPRRLPRWVYVSDR